MLEAVKTLVFLYPDIEWIECADYLGQAHAVFQAKMAAILPSRIRTVCYGHGNHVYLEVNNSQFFFDLAIYEREKACIETADLTLFPSNFLEALYRRAGIHPRKTVRLPYPYTFTHGLADIGDSGHIRNIVFYAKRTQGKGYFLFAEALNLLAGTQMMDGINKIYIAGVGDATADFELFFRLVSGGFKVSIIPETLLFYRVRPGSMLRTYDRFGGFCVLPML